MYLTCRYVQYSFDRLLTNLLRYFKHWDVSVGTGISGNRLKKGKILFPWHSPKGEDRSRGVLMPTRISVVRILNTGLAKKERQRHCQKGKWKDVHPPSEMYVLEFPA
jgi:hypothetical protein